MEELLEQRQQETEDERRELLAMLDDLDRTVRSSTFQAACMEAERAGFVRDCQLQNNTIVQIQTYIADIGIRCARVLGYETTENHPGADLTMIEEMCALGLTMDSLDMHERAIEKRSTTRHDQRLAKIHEEMEQENMNIDALKRAHRQVAEESTSQSKELARLQQCVEPLRVQLQSLDAGIQAILEQLSEVKDGAAAAVSPTSVVAVALTDLAHTPVDALVEMKHFSMSDIEERTNVARNNIKTANKKADKLENLLRKERKR